MGLSVFLSRESALWCGLQVCGICVIALERVYAFDGSLAVIRDSQDHAEIRHVPLFAEDEARAIEIADYLVEWATDVSDPRPAPNFP